jgi:glycosyltransferase involved in cell wall biosynthesis
MPSKVRFSVIVPAYNSAAFIAKALDSALSQTLQPAEVIVINDGSSDETLEIVQRFGNKVRCISHENKGLPAARNTGIENAQYEWIALLDSDDLWRADKLERQAAAILENPTADFVYTACYSFFEDKMEKLVPAPPASRIKQELMNWIPFAVSSVVFRRSKAIEIGEFDPAMRLSEEWDMWHRFIKAGAEFVAIDEPLTFYRRSPGGLSHQAARLLEYQKVVVRKHIASDAPAVERWWKHARLISRLEGEAAIVMRETGSTDCIHHILRSLLRYPLPLSVSDKRYKIALHMLLTKLGLLRTQPKRLR